jgi:hypothetical protein
MVASARDTTTSRCCPRRTARLELAHANKDQVDTDDTRQRRNDEPLVGAHPPVQLIEAGAGRIWSYREAHERDLDDHERYEIEDQKGADLPGGPTPDLRMAATAAR